MKCYVCDKPLGTLNMAGAQKTSGVQCKNCQRRFTIGALPNIEHKRNYVKQVGFHTIPMHYVMMPSMLDNILDPPLRLDEGWILPVVYLTDHFPLNI